MREIRFTKMEGCGNDYIYVNGFTEKLSAEEKPDFVRKMSDRHFGIGGDGVIFINPGKIAEFEMEMYNADGSRSEMCGNGIRCVGKYIYDNKMTEKEEITVESAGAVKYLKFFIKDGKVDSVRVDMGSPILEGERVPVDVSKLSGVNGGNETVVGESIKVNGKDYKITCVSMGNPHAVVFVDETEDITDLDSFDIERTGPFFENHEVFPNRTNTEFVEIIDRGHVKMRVWERGTGETLACGTGCCATAVACVLNGRTDEKVRVDVLGGTIYIEWDRENDKVYMTGPAVTVFEGGVLW